MTNTIFQQLLSEKSIELTGIEVLPGQASSRKYYRLYTSVGDLIGTYSDNVSENKTFFYFAHHFQALQVVPQVIAVSDDQQYYIQQDLGNTSLYDVLAKKGQTDEVYELFQKSLQKLALMQIKGHEGLDYHQCFSTRKFDRQTIIADLYYFKFCFVDALGIPYDKQKLADDFDALIDYLMSFNHQYFMFRDFQSRNIQIKDNEPWFIDFQGGMQGSIAYDVASLLWQSRAGLSLEWKENLLKDYITYANEYLNDPLTYDNFKEEYNGYLFIRMVQVLGAYGFRGLFERKRQFVQSILPALENIKWFLQNEKLGVHLPELMKLLESVTQDSVLKKFTVKQFNEPTPLTVTIQSFSYKKGIPADPTENGGGFVFDCRGILNPGRIQEYKTQSGLDAAVQQFLQTETRMPEFLEDIFKILDISLENYIERGFESLMISYGCTGGQHRSVYATEKTAEYIQKKYPQVSIVKAHTNQQNWVK